MRKIELTQGKYALVDDEDFDWLNKCKWSYCKRGYATRMSSPKANGKRDRLRMHREIMKAPEGKEVDHKNGNGVDNQKDNMRICTHAQNCMNKKNYKNSTSKYKGVGWYKSTKKWRSRIKINGKLINLGYFTCEKEAAKVYDEKAKELFGEFAYLNFKTKKGK